MRRRLHLHEECEIRVYTKERYKNPGGHCEMGNQDTRPGEERGKGNGPDKHLLSDANASSFFLEEDGKTTS